MNVLFLCHTDDDDILQYEEKRKKNEPHVLATYVPIQGCAIGKNQTISKHRAKKRHTV